MKPISSNFPKSKVSSKNENLGPKIWMFWAVIFEKLLSYFKLVPWNLSYLVQVKKVCSKYKNLQQERLEFENNIVISIKSFKTSIRCKKVQLI